jgi:hypothetical protein
MKITASKLRETIYDTFESVFKDEEELQEKIDSIIETLEDDEKRDEEELE